MKTCFFANTSRSNLIFYMNLGYPSFKCFRKLHIHAQVVYSQTEFAIMPQAIMG